MPRLPCSLLFGLTLTSACGDDSAGAGDTDTDTDAGTDTNTGPEEHVGETLWTQTHDGPASQLDAGYGVIADSLGNVILVGMHEDLASEGGRNIWIRKYSPDGETLWTKTQDGPAGENDFAFGVTCDSHDELIVVGGWETSDSDRNIWIRKYSADGDISWTRVIDGPEGVYDNSNGVDVDADDNIIVAGQWTHSGDNINAWVRKFAPNGDVQWTRTHDGPDQGYDAATDVAALPDMRVVVAGRETVAGSTRGWVRLYDADGTELWTQTHDRPAAGANGAAVDSEGNIWIAGSEQAAEEAGGINIWVTKYAPDGSPQWTAIHDGPSSDVDIAHGLDTDRFGNAFVVGRETNLDAGGVNVWIRKYSVDGDELWTKTYDGPASDVDIAAEVATDRFGNVFVAAQHIDLAERGGVNMWLQKYSP